MAQTNTYDFTVRLSAPADKELQKIMDRYNFTAKNKAIQYLILRHISLLDELSKQQEEVKTIRKRVMHLDITLNELRKVFQSLMNTK